MTDTNPDPSIASLDASAPPPDARPPLRALWHGLRGEWQAAHEIVQSEDDRDSAWVHAWLHRVEGDLANARYWYGRAGRQVASGETRAEGLSISSAIGKLAV